MKNKKVMVGSDSHIHSLCARYAPGKNDVCTVKG